VRRPRTSPPITRQLFLPYFFPHSDCQFLWFRQRAARPTIIDPSLVSFGASAVRKLGSTTLLFCPCADQHVLAQSAQKVRNARGHSFFSSQAHTVPLHLYLPSLFPRPLVRFLNVQPRAPLLFTSSRGTLWRSLIHPSSGPLFPMTTTARSRKPTKLVSRPPRWSICLSRIPSCVVS